MNDFPNFDLHEQTVGLVVGIIASLLAAIIIYYFRIIYRKRPWTKIGQLNAYKIKLIDQVKSMPFIYKDVEFEVMDGFVELEIGSLDVKTLKLKNSKIVTDLNEEHALVANAKILFLGRAGFGKTTLQRYAILSILDKSRKQKFIYKTENLIPVFVPLKLLFNISRSPILNHILNTNPYLNNIKRLEKFLIKGKLMFFLDGYDEIRFGENINFIKHELEAIMFPMENEWHKFLDDKLRHLYPYFNMCRVWLSSRKNFFQENPLGMLGSESLTKHPLNFTAVQLAGIGSNRNLLISKIFNRYKKESSRLDKLLFVETFYNSITENIERHIEKLSRSPLFLTVMCYIYISKVKQSGKHDDGWLKDVNDLISECINLLLHDLDTEKVRDLPAAHRAGLKSRRNSFIKEKVDFLRFFAADTYSSKTSVFSYTNLVEKVKEFLEIKSEIKPNAKQLILQELDDKKSLNPNFALQLVFCGVFVVVQKDRNETYYDFPHRRFKEVLASQEFSNPKEYYKLLTKLQGGNYLELMLYFKETKRFKEENFQFLSLQEILNKATCSTDLKKPLIASKHFMEYCPVNLDITDRIQTFIINQLDKKKVTFSIYHELLLESNFNKEFIFKMFSELHEKFHQNNTTVFAMIVQFLSFVADTELVKQINLLNKSYKENLSYPLTRFLVKNWNQPGVKDCINKFLTNQKFRFDLWYAISTLQSEMNIIHIINALKLKNQTYRIELTYFIKVYRKELFDNIIYQTALSDNRDIFDLVLDSRKFVKRKLKFLDTNTKGYYFTRDSLNRISHIIRSEIFEFEKISGASHKSEKLSSNSKPFELVFDEFKKWLDYFPMNTFVEDINPTMQRLNETSESYHFQSFYKYNKGRSKSKGKNKDLIRVKLRNDPRYTNKEFDEVFIELLNRNNTITKRLYNKTLATIEVIDYSQPSNLNFFASYII